MHIQLILRLLIMLSLANGSPILVKALIGDRFAFPLDGHAKFVDGRPVFGAAKTIRGVVASLLITSACAPLLGFSATMGLLIATTAMVGDLFSSFLKRRLGMEPSGRATGLDQIFESLFPLLACRSPLSLTMWDIISGTAIFCIGAVLLSQFLFAIHVRDRPY